GAWSGCQSVAGALCTVQMTQARTVAVTFTPIAYTLQVSPAPSNGAVTGSGISCPGACSASVASGTSVGLTASPATGYQLGAWSGCQSVTGAVCTVQMTQARTVAVTFTPIAYTLQVSPAPSNGAVTGSGISCPGACSASVASGTSVGLTASPAAGYQLGAWSGCQSV